MLKSTPAAKPSGRSSRIVPPPSRPPPVADEKRPACFAAQATSSWRVRHQNPSPSGVLAVGSCQETGASSRRNRNASCGGPSANSDRSVRSNSVNATGLHSARGRTMHVALKVGRTIDWVDGAVVLVDQTRLPGELVVLELTSVADVVDAIKRLAVRGAPAIGVAGAMGVALA